jgi:hypothetical protein
MQRRGKRDEPNRRLENQSAKGGNFHAARRPESSRIFPEIASSLCRSLPSETNFVPRIGKSASRKKTIGFPFRVSE